MTTMEMTDMMMDTMKIQELSQKQIFASFSSAKMNFILCCLVRITTIEMMNPIISINPMNKEA